MLPIWRHRTDVARLSTQDRTKDNNASELNTNVGATGGSGFSGDGDKGNLPPKISHD